MELTRAIVKIEDREVVHCTAIRAARMKDAVAVVMGCGRVVAGVLQVGAAGHHASPTINVRLRKEVLPA